jgi:hypothetical protein
MPPKTRLNKPSQQVVCEQGLQFTATGSATGEATTTAVCPQPLLLLPASTEALLKTRAVIATKLNTKFFISLSFQKV